MIYNKLLYWGLFSKILSEYTLDISEYVKSFEK